MLAAVKITSLAVNGSPSCQRTLFFSLKLAMRIKRRDNSKRQEDIDNRRHGKLGYGVS